MARVVQAKTTSTTRLDTSVIAGVTLDGGVPVRIGLDQAATKASGFMKTANNFLRLLLTEKGSNPLKPQEGTEFPTLFDSVAADEAVLFALVTQHVQDALEQVQAYQQKSGTPEEEQLGSAAIAAFVFDAPLLRLDLSIDLFNPLGERFTLEVPSTVIA